MPPVTPTPSHGSTSATWPKLTSNGWARARPTLRLAWTDIAGCEKQSACAAPIRKWDLRVPSFTRRSPDSVHRDHVQKAMAGAKSDSLLAQNLASNFNHETISELLVAPAGR